MVLFLDLISSGIFFPTNVSTIDLSYETTDTIQEFTVEMQVHYWEAFRGTSAQAGG